MSRPAPVTPSGDEADPVGKRLRELLEPHGCAVLVQELQEGVVGPNSRLSELAEVVHESSVLPRAAKVLEGARRAGVPVIHCTAENLPQGLGRNTNARLFVAARKLGMDNQPGSDSTRPVSDLGPFDTDIVLPRYHGLSPLTGSALDSLLRNSGVRALVVMGVSLNVAIPNLVFDAVNRSYQVVLVSDAIAGVPREYGAQVIEHTLSLLCTIASSAEIVDAWA
jgi:nicotinamidase-related amidase